MNVIAQKMSVIRTHRHFGIGSVRSSPLRLFFEQGVNHPDHV